VGDTVVFTYSDSSSINSCGVFQVWRSNNVFLLTNNIGGGVVAYYFPPNIRLPDVGYLFPISVYMECSTLMTPSSETPATFLFTFMRNNANYLQLTGTFSAVATTFNPANGLLTLTNYQMASTGTKYLFNFTNGQPLSSNPAFVLTFPTDISIASITC
jgi:hypothetical protein